MAFGYRYDDDDMSNYDRYKYSYVAQFGGGGGEGEPETAAARIRLPREAGGNLRDGDGVTYFVYAEYRVVVEERTIFVNKLEVINFDDKVHVKTMTDRIVEFFKDEVLMDRHALDFYKRPPDAPVATSVWDSVGPPVDISAIEFEIKIAELVADRTIDFTEANKKKLTAEWFAPDPDTDLYFL